MVESRILLMGSPVFSLRAFERILDRYPNQVVGVFSQPDRPKGRSKELQPTPVSSWAAAKGLPVWTPETKSEVAAQIQTIQPTIIVVIAYGMILPKIITDSFYCINVHGSLLPQYRGPSPIHSAILNQDSETGVTLIRLNERMDAGDIIGVAKCEVTANDTFAAVHDRLSELGAQACLDCVDGLIKTGTVRQVPQIEADASYCAKIGPEDSIINRGQTPAQTLARIKAFSPIPGAAVIQDGKRIKVLDATLAADGNLEIVSVKPEGKNAMSYADYLRGYPEGITLC